MRLEVEGQFGEGRVIKLDIEKVNMAKNMKMKDATINMMTQQQVS